MDDPATEPQHAHGATERPWRRLRMPAFSAPVVPPFVAPALATGALVLALATQYRYERHPGTDYIWMGFVLAVLLLGAAAFLLWRAGTAGEPAPDFTFTLERRWEIALVLAVFALAAFFRFFRFLEFPPGLWYDEAVNGIDAFSIMDRDYLTVWRESNFGHSTIFFYLLIASFKVFGFTLFAMRLVPALAGMAAVVGFYFLARWLVGPVPALVATALLAVSRWAVTFSRISWEASLQPVLEIMAVYFFVRALETKNKFYFFMAGGSLAAGIYTYLAFRFVPFVMVFLLVYIALTQWRLIRENIVGLVVYAVSFLLVITPLAQYALQNQDQFLARTREINVFKEVEERENYEPLRFNLEASVKMMNVAGDRNGRHNIPGEPMLDEVSAALLVLGFGVSVLSLRNWRKGGIAGWYVLALAPGALTITIENPSAIRGVGAIPPLYLLTGLAVGAIYRSYATSRAGLYAFGLLAVALVGASTAVNYHDIFNRAAKDMAIYDAFQPEFTQIGELVAAEADDHNIYVSRDYDGHTAVKVLARGKLPAPYTPSGNLILPASDKDTLIVIDARQLAMLETLERLYPNLRQEAEVDPFGRVFYLRVTIPAEDVRELHRLPVRMTTGNAEAGDGRAILTRDWTEQDLAGGPITVTWDAYYWSPLPVATTFRLTAPGSVNINVLGQTFGVFSGDLTTPALELPPGENRVTVSAVIDRPGHLAFSFTDSLGRTAAGSDLLYATSAGDHGFRALYRSGGDFSTAPIAIGHMPFAFPADVTPGARAVEYQAIFNATSAGPHVFALDGGNSAQLFVDDTLVVDNGGAHPPRRAEGTIDLQVGEHTIAIQYAVTERPNWALDVRQPSGDWTRWDGTEVRPPSGAYTPPALVTLEPDDSWGGRRTVEGLDRLTGVGVMPDGSVVVGGNDKIAFLNADGTQRNTVSVDADEISDIDVDPQGRIYIVDSARKSLIVLNPDGSPLRRVDSGISSAIGVHVTATTVYVVSPGGGIIYTQPLEGGEFVVPPVALGESPVRAAQPSDVAVNSDGTLYITDFELRSLVIAPQGAAATKASGVGGTGTQLPRLTSYRRFVFLADPLNQRIITYDAAGKQRGVYIFPPTIQGIRPLGIDTTSDGRIYAVDVENAHVQRLLIRVPPELIADLGQ